MILVADAGSSKTDWAIINHNECEFFESPGINPHFLDQDEITEIIHKELPTDILKHKYDLVAFYGAGCSTDRACLKVEEGISAIIQSKRIDVQHDLLGAAIAACGSEPGIACILGTGSNSCFFDGNTIVKSVASPGYLIADEGGGTQLGKQLLLDYLRKDLPENLSAALEKDYRVSEQEILKRLYAEPGPNKYLASFVPFLYEHREDPFIRSLVKRELMRFESSHIARYEERKSLKVNFVGSVAWLFRATLEEIGTEKKFSTGNVVKSPISSLAQFYSDRYEQYVGRFIHND